MARNVSARIGIIADTHGLLRPEVFDAFSGVDHILHAGDVGGEDILAALRKIAPVTFVRGNNDDDDGFGIVRATVGEVRVLLTHILPRPHAMRAAVENALASADVVVFGHSHLPHNEFVGGVRFFNPASAGPRRFDYPIAVGIIEGGEAYHIALDPRSRAALKKRMNQLSR